MILDYNKVWKLKKKYKYLEVQSDWINGWTAIFAFDISINLKDCDHPGWNVRLELFKLWFFQVTYYDSRHWDMIQKDETTNS